VVSEPSLESHADPTAIPEDYDPLAPDDGMPSLSPQAPPVRPRPADRAAEKRAVPPPPLPPPPPAPRPVAPAPVAPLPVVSFDDRPPIEIPVLERERPAARAAVKDGSAGSLDFGAVLRGAGLDPANVTPDVAREFGQILRVVVSGLMDVMRSRQQIKDE